MTAGALSSGWVKEFDAKLLVLEVDIVSVTVEVRVRVIPIPTATKAPMSSWVVVLFVLEMELKALDPEMASFDELIVLLLHSAVFDSAMAN